MAGGIDWFRWHHGSVNDQKFPLVARRAGASVAEVIAVWACLLERASMNEESRGQLGDVPDFEAMDCALGLPDGRCEAVFAALQQRGMVDEAMGITAWDKRQPRREDTTAADRKRAQRERDAAAQRVTPPDVTQCHAESRDVTACHDRGEERREEKENPPSLRSGGSAPKRATRKCPEGFEVSLALQTWAREHHPGVDVPGETDKFRDHTFKTSISDWDGAWRNWIRRCGGFGPQARASPGAVNRQEAIEARNRAVGEQWLAAQGDER